MKLLVEDPVSTSVITSVENGIPGVSRYPRFIVEPESRDDIAEAMRLFGDRADRQFQ